MARGAGKALSNAVVGYVDRKDIHGHRLVPNDKEDWIIIRDTHQGLIDRRQFEIAKNKRLNKIESIQQRGIYPRLKTHGKTWDGKRSRFILSGFIIPIIINSFAQYMGNGKST